MRACVCIQTVHVYLCLWCGEIADHKNERLLLDVADDQKKRKRESPDVNQT